MTTSFEERIHDIRGRYAGNPYVQDLCEVIDELRAQRNKAIDLLELQCRASTFSKQLSDAALLEKLPVRKV